MKFIRIIFVLAAAWGFFALVPGLFDEAGPRPEYYYGFIGLALVFQLIFILIAFDPARYRPLIPIGVLEKLAFFLPVTLLYLQGRVAMGPVFFGAMVDGLFMLLFAASWMVSRREGQAIQPL
ncbi:MAG: hypothetical protein GW808_09205 [Sphingomonadales bacterium]|nr:hypothetical protein [Sphingomonadales bacterium]PIX66249.1 MAG: hypothetical protein COZ43_07610 [Sphingomonadales bacterium CG_4_10_14_3_um_filter_58_15]NCO49434.1 hypothetical protein [Sphingomonadales bacterium]NCP00787.1 hypothetical protein [Sphingomonadales bacterium]NCP26351.1 hypothetical protein [Sphingomonadales bacterium]